MNYKRTKEHSRKILESRLKNGKPWFPCGTKEKISNSLLDNHNKPKDGMNVKCYKCGKIIYRQKYQLKTKRKNYCSNECQTNDCFKDKPSWNKGKKASVKTKKKMSETHKRMKGVMANNWQGGITPISLKIRHSIESRLWREAVFARDNYTCQKTGIKGSKLCSHHIINFSSHPELRFAINNGITLSEKSHKEFHKKYGIRNNTKEQLEKYLCE